jgi:DNA-binding NarL/FixJ family response regulator
MLVAESLSALLADEADFEVVGVATTAAAAVDLAAREHPDVAVVDFRLPDRDGVTVAADLRAAAPGIELVMMTAVPEQAVVNGALEAGYSGFVRKSSPAEELLAALRAVGRGESHFEAEVLMSLVRARRPEGQGGNDVLSERELEVLRLVAAGRGTGEIAADLNLSQHTVRNHVRNILGKLGAHSKLEAVVMAARAGLVQLAESS